MEDVAEQGVGAAAASQLRPDGALGHDDVVLLDQPDDLDVRRPGAASFQIAPSKAGLPLSL